MGEEVKRNMSGPPEGFLNGKQDIEADVDCLSILKD
jgi:hypothetical protein